MKLKKINPNDDGLVNVIAMWCADQDPPALQTMTLVEFMEWECMVDSANELIAKMAEYQRKSSPWRKISKNGNPNKPGEYFIRVQSHYENKFIIAKWDNGWFYDHKECEEITHWAYLESFFLP